MTASRPYCDATLRRRSSARVASRRRFHVALGCFLGASLTGLARSWGQEAASQPKAKSSLLTPAIRTAVDRGLEYLRSRQNEDGSFGTGDYSRNVAVVSLSAMAFLAQGSSPQRGKYQAVVAKALEFVLASGDDSGLINVAANTDRGPMYGHGFSTLFLAEVFGMAPGWPVRETLTRAVQLILTTQNNEGGWRYEPRPDEADISVTVSQMMALRAAKNAGIRVPSETMDRAVQYIKQCQNPDGGFNYMLNLPRDSRFPRSAAAVVALLGAGLYDSDEVRRGINYVKKHVPAVNRITDQGYFLYGHYYAAQAMWHVGGEEWSRWYSAIRDYLMARQKQDGLWEDAISPEYGTAMSCLVLLMPNNYLPIFQR